MVEESKVFLAPHQPVMVASQDDDVIATQALDPRDHAIDQGGRVVVFGIGEVTEYPHRFDTSLVDLLVDPVKDPPPVLARGGVHQMQVGRDECWISHDVVIVVV